MIQIELKNKVKEPRITLVGAGPGDADLITIKGIKALKTADVVLYDALVNEELLEFAPEHAVKVYVGKRSGDHSFSQGNINKLMIDYAINYGHVVRLKGGDPFVFGRGYEELDFEKLLIQLSEIKGKFLLSSYPSELLAKYVKKNNWHQQKIEMKMCLSGNPTVKTKVKTEVLTANYEI